MPYCSLKSVRTFVVIVLVILLDVLFVPVLALAGCSVVLQPDGECDCRIPYGSCDWNTCDFELIDDVEVDSNLTTDGNYIEADLSDTSEDYAFENPDAPTNYEPKHNETNEIEIHVKGYMTDVSGDDPYITLFMGDAGWMVSPSALPFTTTNAWVSAMVYQKTSGLWSRENQNDMMLRVSSPYDLPYGDFLRVDCMYAKPIYPAYAHPYSGNSAWTISDWARIAENSVFSHDDQYLVTGADTYIHANTDDDEETQEFGVSAGGNNCHSSYKSIEVVFLGRESNADIDSLDVGIGLSGTTAQPVTLTSSNAWYSVVFTNSGSTWSSTDFGNVVVELTPRDFKDGDIYIEVLYVRGFRKQLQ